MLPSTQRTDDYPLILSLTDVWLRARPTNSIHFEFIPIPLLI